MLLKDLCPVVCTALGEVKEETYDDWDLGPQNQR